MEKGRLYGRGTCDTKAGVAEMMHALLSLKRDRTTPPCEIWVVAAADEEYAYRGAAKLCEGLTATGAVVAEPTQLRLAIAHKGVLRWKICCQGKAAHSSKPHLGVNAITNMARLIGAIEEDSQTLSRRGHPLLGNATCNIGVIQGGRQVNFVPDFCSIGIDRRLLPGEEFADVLAHYQRILDAHPEGHAYMETPMLKDLPLETSAESEVVRCARGVLTDLRLPDAPVRVPY